ncbi:DUF4843 domain-containing protein [Filimonas lacunae]|nr:DUF4843 domain-containing protein [Filimonas lacunae]BAV05121.1 hypothetical protein FLA_1128 [Filimonas lacunae]
MKKIFFVLLFIQPLFFSCKKADELLYDSADNICFNFLEKQKDSIIYTFAYTPEKAFDTIFLPVRISGLQRPFDRKFVLTVMQDSSTAQEGLHYEALKDYYIMPADTGKTKVPLIIYNKDAALIENSVSIRLLLQSSGDFGANILTAIKGKVVFSATLERPDWWGSWPLGTYSRTKHQLFIIATGVTTLTTSGLDAPKNLYLVSLLTSLLNDPFTWVKRNSDKGYVIEALAGSNDYYFYSTSNPAKKFLYRKDDAGAGYHFIDEKGLLIN